MGNTSRRSFLKMTGLAAASALGASGCTGAVSDSGKIKIGISIWSATDVLGSASVDIIKKAAEALGDVEIAQISEQGHVSEQVTASIETLCNAGCQGIVVCNTADSEMVSAINTCNDHHVYLAQFYRMISEKDSPDIYEYAKNSEYFVGSVHENEIVNGETLVELLAKDRDDVAEGIRRGSRNIMLEGWTVGDATFQKRWEGYKSGVEKWNKQHPDDQIKLSDPYYANTSSSEGANIVQQFYNQNPHMDALIVAGGGGNPLVGSVAQLANLNLTGKVRVVSTDFLEDLEDMLESGAIYAESGGHFCDPLYAFLLVYNAIKGTYSVKSGEYGYEIEFPYVYVSSVDEYKDYEKYFVQTPPYNDEEMKGLAAMSFEELKEAASKLSIEDVKKRHS